jgi:hypothetical protein
VAHALCRRMYDCYTLIQLSQLEGKPQPYHHHAAANQFPLPAGAVEVEEWALGQPGPHGLPGAAHQERPLQ